MNDGVKMVYRSTKDGTECIAEVGVMIDRGDADKVPKDAMELFIKYMGNRL